jgi:hypothetical protein
MKQTITNGMFIEAFKLAGREKQFSRKALTAILDHIEQIEGDTGIEQEFDIVGICTNYVEATYEQIMRGDKLDDDDDIGAKDTVIRYLDAHTTIVEAFDDTIVYENF